jgi:hypothetical protein
LEFKGDILAGQLAVDRRERVELVLERSRVLRVEKPEIMQMVLVRERVRGQMWAPISGLGCPVACAVASPALNAQLAAGEDTSGICAHTFNNFEPSTPTRVRFPTMSVG